MSIKQQLEESFVQLERHTVSDSFGGSPIEGRAPDFAFKPIMEWLGTEIENCDEELQSSLSRLNSLLNDRAFKYTLHCLGRFCFCIELTNLSITSTKMKTRWLSGNIMKTRPDSFENYESEFSPGNDERSVSFDECYEILKRCADLLVESEDHGNLMEKFSQQKRRSTPYESVFTYIDTEANPVHTRNNIRLVNFEDANWLTKARPIIHPILQRDLDGNKTKVVEKIATKCYKTDRSQTGEVQTNRAKRWECLTIDFQRATIEECWSVERKLLSDVAHFQGFPEDTKQELITSGLFGSQETTLCPITFKPMIFQDLLGGGRHGESIFQVGHMMPLKAGGHHTGDNIEWISKDGNRIQGSLNIQDTREMLVGIFTRMMARGLIEA